MSDLLYIWDIHIFYCNYKGAHTYLVVYMGHTKPSELDAKEDNILEKPIACKTLIKQVLIDFH